MSPSRRIRNEQRKLDFDQRKHTNNIKNSENVSPVVKCDDVMVEHGVQCDMRKDSIEKEIQVDVKTKDTGTNTEYLVVDSLEDTLKINDNGSILPLAGETLVEMRVNHDFKSWDKIGQFIEKSLKMNLHGRPWLSNNGKHFKTVGFRTSKQEYECWKIRTFNWQDSGIREAANSKLYK